MGSRVSIFGASVVAINVVVLVPAGCAAPERPNEKVGLVRQFYSDREVAADSNQGGLINESQTGETIDSGIGVPGAAGDPSEWGICGLTKVEGPFDSAGAEVRIIPDGTWKLKVAKSIGATSGPKATMECIFLTAFVGTPALNRASTYPVATVNVPPGTRDIPRLAQQVSSTDGELAWILAGFKGTVISPAGTETEPGFDAVSDGASLVGINVEDNGTLTAWANLVKFDDHLWRYVAPGSQYDRFCWLGGIGGPFRDDAQGWLKVNADGNYASTYENGARGLTVCLSLDQTP